MSGRLLLFISGLALLAGCGGGGGGGIGSSGGLQSEYTGATNQAVVNGSNARTLSLDAYGAGQLSAATSGIAKSISDKGAATALLQQTSTTLKNCVTASFNDSSSPAKSLAAATPTVVYGYSGSYTAVINRLPGIFNGTIVFTGYRETSSSPLINGTITFDGTFNLLTGLLTRFSIHFDSLSGSDATGSFSMKGSITLRVNDADTTLTMSVVLIDNVTYRTYWVKNYLFTDTGTTTTLSGTYYDPIHGYVVISTISPLTFASLDSTPTSGQLLFTGSSGTKVRLTFTSLGYTVEVDASGSGSYVPVP